MGEEVMNYLAQYVLELEDRIEERDRAAEQMTTDEFIDQMRNKNTSRKTNSDVNKLKTWLSDQNELREFHKIPPQELDLLLARFFMTAKKCDGGDYEPDTLKSIQGSINRHLTEKHCNIDLIKDKEFKHSRDVLMSKRKLLRQNGKGNKQKKTEPLTKEEIDILYQKKLLGAANPRALTNTVFLNNSMFFGMRSRLEHQNLRWGDIDLKTTSAGEKYLEFTERATKTRSGATSDARAFSPKMFENKGDPRCPVSLYLMYAGKRPEKMKADDSKFYVGINNKGYGDEWFINQPMGKNTLSNIIKSMTDEAGIQGRKVNHSARKTGITTLIHAGVQNTLVQQHSGHKSLSSINNYSSASFQQQKDMSKVLCTFTSNQDSTTDINQNTIQPGDSTANLNNVDTIPDDDDDMVLVRASQEMIENTLLDIENFENYEVLDIHNDIHVDNCKKSSNLVQKNTDMSVRMSENYSVPSILHGATVKGNVIINYGNPIEEKENYQRQTRKKRKWVIYDSSDSD
ncbi:unnamed protein product [Mytilus coruscus]|uniref:Tyr recombinase domain-containing protein n=1 Tax=Mytilus coruscus TaxID=42192 RepID=A0A6J8B1S1_MYTCO|nr:unnamed protein product [Mytilus coruscus]